MLPVFQLYSMSNGVLLALQYKSDSLIELVFSVRVRLVLQDVQ